MLDAKKNTTYHIKNSIVFNIFFFLYFFLQTKPLQGQAQDLVKAFVAKIEDVGKELKAKNPELFSGDTKKLQVSSLLNF